MSRSGQENAVTTNAGGRASEFIMTDQDFRFFADLIGKRAGIVITEVKKPLVYGRLVRRVRALKLSGFREYCELLARGDDTECEQFTNALTTNLTSFFREPRHFEFLRETLLPKLMKQSPNRKRLRIWSAGCSTGEEPYSLAMTVAEVVPSDWDVKILATDLDSQVIARASAGVYASERTENISQGLLKRWFQRGGGERADMMRVRQELRDMITFLPLNLLEPWPLRGQFDIIFCRNVVIYFDKPTQRVLFNRFAEQLRSDGHLFVGHSETLYKVSDRFTLLGNTIYGRAT
ncbi:MAG: protein-glutamate O-methyltransferase CheR [Gammaproteobacteria bacterium]|nr:protein-glutamate O-methyltransferase CheR [Gammaproteobacteria bacterium]